MLIRCIIVDDEQPARDELRYLLSSFDDVEIIGDVDSVGKAATLIEKSSPDRVFLDIQMPGRTGFDLIKMLSHKDQLPLFVFVTAYDNYAVKAFENWIFDISRARMNLFFKKIAGFDVFPLIHCFCNV